MNALSDDMFDFMGRLPSNNTKRRSCDCTTGAFRHFDLLVDKDVSDKAVKNTRREAEGAIFCYLNGF